MGFAERTLLERYNYTPYGEVTLLNADFRVKATQEGAIGNLHLYTGRERDHYTGLQLNRHRFYASHLGRWLTRDPIRYDGSQWNLYEYVNCSPAIQLDSMGLGEYVWPFNSKICNDSPYPIWVHPGSTGKGEWLQPGECTSHWTDEGDFFYWDCSWWKIGWGTGGLDEKCRPYDCELFPRTPGGAILPPGAGPRWGPEPILRIPKFRLNERRSNPAIPYGTFSGPENSSG